MPGLSLLSRTRGLTPRDFPTLLPGFAEADGDRLLPTLHFASRAALQRPFLLAMHRRLDAFARRLAVFSHECVRCKCCAEVAGWYEKCSAVQPNERRSPARRQR